MPCIPSARVVKKSYTYREASHVSQYILDGGHTCVLSKLVATVVYIDETGVDERDQYAYGWSLQGKRCLAKRSRSRGRRLSLISAVLCSAPQMLIQPYMFEGHCDRVWVEYWLERLCQHLPYGEKHYLIMDNVSFPIRLNNAGRY